MVIKSRVLHDLTRFGVKKGLPRMRFKVREWKGGRTELVDDFEVVVEEAAHGKAQRRVRTSKKVEQARAQRVDKLRGWSAHWGHAEAVQALLEGSGCHWVFWAGESSDQTWVLEDFLISWMEGRNWTGMSKKASYRMGQRCWWLHWNGQQ